MKSRTERDYRERLARSVNIVLAAPAGSHTLEALADAANCSPFHFQRVYSAIFGESPTATVRRIRLAGAAHLLASSDTPITTIALDAGYGSSQAFARAFRNFAHFTPGEFRTLQRSLADERVSNGAGGRIRIIEQPAFEVVAVPHDGPVATIPFAFRKLQCWRSGHAGFGNAPPVGVFFQDHERPEKMRYFAGLRVPSRTRSKGLARSHLVGGGWYATVRLTGPYALIAPTFKTLIEQWLPRSGFCLDRRPALELYRGRLGAGPTKMPTTELLLPIA